MRAAQLGCRHRYLATAVCALLALLASARAVLAGRLPLTHFTMEQGLASDSVRCAVQDRDGFIWFGTGEGLSRFDGHEFRNFGREAGLETTSVHDLLVWEDGALLVGTPGGLYRFDPSGGGSFTKIRSEPSTDPFAVYLLRDRRGTVWAGANGLYRLDRDADGSNVLRRVPFPHPGQDTEISHLAEGRDGSLWIASHGLYRYSDGRGAQVCGGSGGAEWFMSIARDSAGRLWAASAKRGLMLVDDTVDAGPAGACRPAADLPAYFGARQLLPGRDGSIWTGPGVAEVRSPGGLLRTITRANGLPDLGGWPLLLDGGGNLWIGTDVAGVARLAREGFTSFGPADGIEEPRSAGITPTGSGLLIIGSSHIFHVFDGARFHAVRPNLPQGVRDMGWGWRQFEMQDRDGGWWIPTGEGIFRFPPSVTVEDLAHARPTRRYTEEDGLPSRGVFRLFEDAEGGVWASTFWPESGQPSRTLSRWDRQSGRFQQYGQAQGVTESAAPTAFLQCRDGSVWIGYFHGDVYRYRRGAFKRLFDGQGGMRGSIVSGIHQDRQGKVWIATGDRGVCRVDDPAADDPSFVRLTTREGLATDQVNDVTEDDRGRIYLATDLGVDILEDDRVIRHLDVSDGLPSRHVVIARWTAGLGLWFGTIDGPARLDPSNVYDPPSAPRVRIDALRVAGVPRRLSALGETLIPDLVLSPDEQRMQIDFMALTGDPARTIRFQYRLGSDEPWSEPTADRSLVLPGLSSGRYRLELRAVDAAGSLSPEPAVVAFRVLAPVWRRAWFLALVGAAAAGLVAAAYRARVRHLIALERQRTRIAMDLHDEMGSGLGSIGVLADLAGDERLESDRRRDLLDQVASTAAELGASMSDIVSSLRPGAATLEALGHHLSERGRRMFPGGGARLEIRLPEPWPAVRLTPTVRHNVALIGLEALHNAARHSGARAVCLELALDPDARWRLTIRDDGRGLDRGRAGANGGLGLESMRRRADRIGADLRLDGGVGEGMTVTLLFDPSAEERRPSDGGRRII